MGGFDDFFELDGTSLGASTEEPTNAGVTDLSAGESESDVNNDEGQLNEGDQGSAENEGRDESQGNEDGNQDGNQGDANGKEEEGSDDSSASNELAATDYSGLTDKFIEEGLLDFDDDKEYDFSKNGGIDAMKEVIQDTREKSKSLGVDEYKNGLSPEMQRMLEIQSNGGSINDFFAEQQEDDFSSVDLYNEDGSPIGVNQELLIRDLMFHQGETDQDKIQERIEKLKNADLLEDEASRAKNILATNQANVRQERDEAMKAEQAARIQKEKEQSAAFESDVKGLRKVGDFNLSEKEASDLYEYITKPVGPKGETQYMLDDNFEHRMMQAYMQKKGFSKKKLSEDIRSEQVRKINKKFSENNDTAATMKGGNSRGGSGSKIVFNSMFE